MSDSEKDLNKTELENVSITPDPDPTAAKDDNKASEGTPQKPKKSKSDIVRLVIQIVAATVAIVCIGFLVYKYVKSKNENKANDNIRKEAGNENASSAEVTVDDGGSTTEVVFSLSDIDFDKLYADAGDTLVGWIEVPSVGISYPVVQGEDNDFYMQHNYAGDFAWSGSIYLDCKSPKDMTDARTILYGHHMTDGSMFAGLLEYDSEDFYKKQEAKDNNYFFLYTPKQVYVYKIFSVCDVTYDENPETYVIIHSGEDNVNKLLTSLNSLALYDTGVEAKATDDILTLYTCQYDAASGIRHMVHGKLITTIAYEDAK